jgi:heme A synthase
VDAEPRGHTIDGTPWEEPRPPHLPDRLTSISPWVLPFLVVAVTQLWVLWINQPLSTNQGSAVEYWLGTRYQFAEIAGALIGLALFLRHPDARRTLPQVAWGALLLLLAQVMGLLEQTLDPVFVALAPPSEDLYFFSPLREAYSIFTSLVALFGIAFIASGLSAARRYESTGPGRTLVAALVILAVVSAAGSMLWLPAEFDVSPALVGTIIGTLVARFLRTLAFSYLVVITAVGWLAQEEPRSAWRLAAVGAGLLLFSVSMAPFIGLLPLSPEGLLAAISPIQEGVFVGWVLLVAAFALGLPSTAPIPDDETATATPDRPAATTPGSAGG